MLEPNLVNVFTPRESVALLLLALASACSTVPKKDRAGVCENDDCETSDDDKKKKPADKGNGGPSGSPLQPAEQERDAEVEPTPDAGSDSGSSLGPSCTALADCCEALTEAGITGSASQCRSVVSDGNELSCQLAHEDYKKPDDFYDPVCF